MLEFENPADQSPAAISNRNSISQNYLSTYSNGGNVTPTPDPDSGDKILVIIIIDFILIKVISILVLHKLNQG